MRAVRVPKASRRNARVQDREIRGMKDAVADAHQRGDRIKPQYRRRETRDDRSSGEQREPAEQHRTGAEAIDGKSGGELGEPASEIERACQGAQRRVRDVELGPQEREHRGQNELEEVRQPVGEPDQPDDLHIVAERVGADGIQGEFRCEVRNGPPLYLNLRLRLRM